jgi:hypothetical protein
MRTIVSFVSRTSLFVKCDTFRPRARRFWDKLSNFKTFGELFSVFGSESVSRASFVVEWTMDSRLVGCWSNRKALTALTALSDCNALYPSYCCTVYSA